MSRRTLRLWPIKGTADAEVFEGAIHFIRNKLLVDISDVDNSIIESVRRIKHPRNSKIKFEALVRFSDKFSRDCVASHAKNLSEYRDTQGNSCAGVRIDFPDYMAPDFRILEWFGAALRKRHGFGFKRNVKFDNDMESLFMDVNLPSSEEWRKVYPQAARLAKEEQSRADAEETKLALSSMPPVLTGANRTPLLNLGRSDMTASRSPGGSNRRSRGSDSYDRYVSPQKL